MQTTNRTAKHTPSLRPGDAFTARYQCRCTVTATPASETEAVVYCNSTINWCPLHAQAPALLADLKKAVQVLDGIGDKAAYLGVDSADWASMCRTARKHADDLRATIARAEGRDV